MADRKFLKRETKVFSLVTSILIAIALLVLVIAGMIGGNFLNFSVIGSSVIAFISAIFMGAMQIRVFSNYKSQKKYLCADGIFYICLTILVLVSAISYVLVSNAQVDLRYFIFVFGLAFALWKIFIGVLGFKNKYYNAFAEIIIALFWILSAVGVLLTINVELEQIGLYLLCVSNYLLGIATIFYILFSYVFKEPNFLITDEAIAIFDKEESERQQRLNRFGGRYVVENNSQQSDNQKKENLEDKLAKLQTLKEKKFITEEEYEKRKQALLDSEL